MDVGMKEDMKMKHGYMKTNDIFAFDEGLAGNLGSHFTAVRPIMAALEVLEMSPEEYEDVSEPEQEDQILC